MLVGECLKLGEGELLYAPVIGALRGLEGVEVCDELGIARLFGDMMLGENVRRFVRIGDWDRAEALLDVMFDSGPTGVGVTNAYGPRATLEVLRGDDERAWEAIAQGERHVAPSSGSISCRCPTGRRRLPPRNGSASSAPAITVYDVTAGPDLGNSCARYLRPAGGPPAQALASQRRQELALARCMRAHV